MTEAAPDTAAVADAGRAPPIPRRTWTTTAAAALSPIPPRAADPAPMTVAATAAVPDAGRAPPIPRR